MLYHLLIPILLLCTVPSISSSPVFLHSSTQQKQLDQFNSFRRDFAEAASIANMNKLLIHERGGFFGMDDYLAGILNPGVSQVGCAFMKETCHVKVWERVQKITHVETLDVHTICLLDFPEDSRVVERFYGRPGGQCPGKSEDGLCIPMENGEGKH